MSAFDGSNFRELLDLIRNYRPKIVQVTKDAFWRTWDRTREEHHIRSVGGEPERIEMYGTSIVAPDMPQPVPLAGVLDLRGDAPEFKGEESG